MKRIYFGVFVTALLLIYMGCAPTIPPALPTYDYAGMDKFTRKVHKKVELFLARCLQQQYPVKLPSSVRIDSLYANKQKKEITVVFNKPFSYPAYRPDNVNALYRILRSELGKRFSNYHLVMQTLNRPVQALIPNYYRQEPEHYDYSRMPAQPHSGRRYIANRSRPYTINKGLNNRHIALWHSHGWYFDHKQNRWQWQRPRLFQTVEDLLPMAFTLPYLIPMLENAGARVFVPRERDVQKRECVVDNDGSLYKDRSIYRQTGLDGLHKWITAADSGFALGEPPYCANENPFTKGTYVTVLSDTVVSAKVEWIPSIPATGHYAVYISYHASDHNSADASYTICHLGGKTKFMVDQRIGGATWIYLGRFKFKKGIHPDSGSVVLTNKSNTPGLTTSADAVRFGGGMGNVLRGGRTSGRPRFTEAARYYLQYAGMPDTLVYNLNDNHSDYKDDYQCRGEYVNYLVGAPAGPNKNRNASGLDIPIDASLAFHTDAGFRQGDSTIGTLSIFSLYGADTTMTFPDGMSRYANRDLADILQTQIVEDIRKKWNRKWRRRSLYNALYSEAYRPNIPSVLIELLSHQNFTDMKYALDPRFRFDVSRAMYKGLARFIAFQHRQFFVVTPLPVTHLYAKFCDKDSVFIEWRPRHDPLEPSAAPTGYILYTRKNDRGFDNGQYFSEPYATVPIDRNTIYSYKVSAVNAGGESFASEIISVGLKKTEPVLLVNGFDRICGPAVIDQPDFRGVFNIHDEGVPDRYDLNFTGIQLNYNPFSPFRSNDDPGFGESMSDFETQRIAGNSFDFCLIHGKSLFELGYSFVSCSDEAVMDSMVDLVDYSCVDFIFGEEKTTIRNFPTADSLYQKNYTVFPPPLQQKLATYCQQGGKVFISGAYVATDLLRGKPGRHPDVNFARKILKLDLEGNYGAGSGHVFSISENFIPFGHTVQFNCQYTSDYYAVEAPDAISAVNGSTVILRYRENERGAAVAYSGTYRMIVFGFPFESIFREKERHGLMRGVTDFLFSD